MHRSWTPFCLVPGIKRVPPSHCAHRPACSRPPQPSVGRSADFHRRQSCRNPKRMRSPGRTVSSVKGRGRREICGPLSSTYSPVNAAFCHFEHAFLLGHPVFPFPPLPLAKMPSFPPSIFLRPDYIRIPLGSTTRFNASLLLPPSLSLPLPLLERKVTLKVCRSQWRWRERRIEIKATSETQRLRPRLCVRNTSVK